MPNVRRDPRLDEAISFLPANGQSIQYEAWLSAMRSANRFDLVRLVHKLRHSGDVVFEIMDDNDPVASHSVRRAAAAAPAAAPAAVPPVPRTPGA